MTAVFCNIQLFIHFLTCLSLAVTKYNFSEANPPQDMSRQSLIYTYTAIYGPVSVSMAIVL